jgi:hypothetical protein
MKGKRILLTALMLVLLASIFTIIAYAGTHASTSNYFTASGVRYENWARVWTTTTGADGAGNIWPTDNSLRPVGDIGARGRLYNSSNVLLRDSLMVYNSSPSRGLTTLSPWHTGVGTYNSYSQTAAYHGVGSNPYHVANTNRTRNIPTD